MIEDGVLNFEKNFSTCLLEGRNQGKTDWYEASQNGFKRPMVQVERISSNSKGKKEIV